MKSLNFKSCFISAPAGTNLNPLRRELEKRNISWLDQSQMRFGEGIVESVINGIKSADFVCIILPKTTNYLNVIFEFGIATAKNKPMIVFIDPKIKQSILPSILYSYTYARLKLDDRDALALHLDAFLKYASPKMEKRPTKKQKSVKSRDIPWVSEAFRSIEEKGVEQFENLVVRLLKEAGAIVSKQYIKDKRVVDLAVWIDSLQNSLGNPIPVELKYGLLTLNILNQAKNKLRFKVKKIGSFAGLLIYYDKNQREFPSRIIKWPLIIHLSLQELISLVKKGNFEKELIRRRNMIVHGYV